MSKTNLSRQTVRLYWQASRGFRGIGLANLLLAAAGVISGQVLLNAVFAQILNKISAGEQTIAAFVPLLGLYALLALIELAAWRLSV